jgi:hypothetical protein
MVVRAGGAGIASLVGVAESTPSTGRAGGAGTASLVGVAESTPSGREAIP